jgi:hypothetical protein
MTASYALKDLWQVGHRFCADDPGPIDSLDEARFILTTHSGHGSHCRQYLAAQKRASVVLP